MVQKVKIVERLVKAPKTDWEEFCEFAGTAVIVIGCIAMVVAFVFLFWHFIHWAAQQDQRAEVTVDKTYWCYLADNTPAGMYDLAASSHGFNCSQNPPDENVLEQLRKLESGSTTTVPSNSGK